ncbi:MULTISPECIES: Cys-tRNA(Pro) deacylase [unclassified Exiguobacterium]|uniref:Cys-tRNA(Pro) deacylase n=1 Tax=unclassified Exiguobacterium TaxID=2644629 RepID=UPI001BED21A5|nr:MULTISPECIES: Cys-tRNA(Pro) deacylase [unclassified Exiguobacterium]
MSKTNAERLLKQSNVSFESISYPVDLSDLSAQAVSEKIKFPLSSVFKTLVLEDDQKNYLFSVISGEEEVNLKAVARASGAKKMSLVPMKALESLTGYVRGGVSPIGAKKAFPVFLSDRAIGQPFIIISAGKRGQQIKLSPDDLLEFTSGILYRNR